MKYIKLFNEAGVEGTRMTQWYQPDQVEELLGFSNDNLAYLVDDGFKIKIEDETSDQYDAIRIRKGERPFDGPFEKLSFNWEEVKNIFLPFFIRLDRKYEVMVITFFTSNLGRSVSFTKDGAARIQELLDEEKSYNNIRGWDFEEIRIKVKKLPLIYNRNESFDRWSRDQKAELTEYCETNLAYLIDEGFKIRIGQNIDKTMSTFGNISIQIKYVGTAGDTEEFFYTDIKNQFIPFVLRLEKEYDIKKIRFLGQDNFRYIKDNFEEELDTQPLNKVSYIDIFLSGEKEKLNESLSPKEELEDFCDTYLSYLTDEGFYIDYEELYGGHCTNVTIRHSKREDSKYSYDFSWDEIKDRFIPFLQILSKQYKLFNFHHEDFNCKKNQVVCMRRLDDLLSSDYYSYDDVIKDTINTDYLFYIKLKVGGKLT